MSSDWTTQLLKPNQTCSGSSLIKWGFKIPDELGWKLLNIRGIGDDYKATKFFLPKLEQINQPVNLPSVSQGVERILTAIHQKESIGIFGDFDADGLTGTAIITRMIRKLGGHVTPYIPNRDKDGHGLSNEAISSFHQAGIKVIITVDTGSTAVEETEMAKIMGIDTIITDHHLPQGDLPDVTAFINPMISNPVECEYSGSGVAFKLAQALSESTNLDFPEDLLPLASIGTISDFSPLVGENRAIVKNGLELLGQTHLQGLRALLEKSRSNNYSGKPDTDLVSFQIAPRLNAPGRLGDSEPALQILLTENPDEAAAISARLEECNNQRRAYSQLAWDLASKTIDENRDSPIIHAKISDLPTGILGPTAGRIVEKTGKPAIVYKIENGVAKASCRSNELFDIHAGLSKSSNLMQRFGGHAGAAGFSALENNFETIIKTTTNEAAKTVYISGEKIYQIDASIGKNQLKHNLWEFVRGMEPYGSKNPKPLFSILSSQITDIKTVGSGGSHLKLKILTDEGPIEGIGFGLGKNNLGKGLVDMVFGLRTDNWRGKTKEQLEIKAIKPSQ